MTTIKKTRPNIHRILLWTIPLFFFLFGVVEIFTASRFQSQELKNNEFYFAIIHVFWVILGIGVSVIMSFLPSQFWKKVSTFMFYGTVVMLVAVLFTPRVNGSRRWFEFFQGITIQPSEFAKVVVAVYGAYLIEKFSKGTFHTYKDHLTRYLFPVLVRVSILILLIVIQPDLGTAVVLFASFFVMYVVRGGKYLKRDLLLLGIIGVMGLTLFSAIESYRVGRINTYITLLTTGKIEDEFGAGYQLRNILIGVGSGGWWGKGIGQSRQRFGYLVEVTAFTDSISAVVFEELGFVLSTLFISGYFIYFWAGSAAAAEQKNEYARLALWGLVSWFTVQTFLHFAANLAIIPVKGIPLPFITYGGSSILAASIGAGIIYRLSSPLSETASKTRP